MESTLNWAAVAVAGIILCIQLFGWLRTAALFGGISRPMVSAMIHLTLHSRRLRFMLLHLVGVVGVILFWAADRLSFGCAVLACAAACSYWTRSAMPPVAVLLAGSNLRTGELLRNIRVAVYPLRVVVLLDPKRLQQSLTHRMADQDNLRTTDGLVWKSVIHHLIGMARIVVIDTRESTDPVHYETLLMLDPVRMRKAVFLGTDDGRCPSLDKHGIDPTASAIPVYSARELPGLLRDMTESRNRLPDPEDVSEVGGIVVREAFETLPSVLAVGIELAFDSDEIAALARNTQQDLIELYLPNADLDESHAKELMELTFDFSRNQRLVGSYHPRRGVLTLRRIFLIEVSQGLPRTAVKAQHGRLIFNDLLRPDPVLVGIEDYCNALRWAAAQRGLEFRTTNT